MEAALLLGNGLNRLAGKVGWKTLVSALAPDQDKEYKSLSSWPLEFEKIYGERNRNSTGEEICKKYKLKEEIQKMIMKENFSDDELSLARGFTRLPVKHIMTTNYDYNLEISVNPPFDRKKSPGKTKEKLCSLYRSLMPDYRSLQGTDKVVWHIHGEAGAPESICLGFEHYCVQLAAMRQFLTKPYQDDEPPYLTNFLRNGGLEPQSWLTLFFTHNVYIIGLGLSFMEIDLWWLLTYRYQYQLKHPEVPKNRIVYFYHPKEGAAEELQLMPAVGVETKALGSAGNCYHTFYQLALDEVQKAVSDSWNQ